MKKLLRKFEDIMVAVTFAEAGEYDLARKLSQEEPVIEDNVKASPETETA